MKIKPDFVMRRVGNSYVAVATGAAAKSFNGMLKLNESAAFLWESLRKGATEEELAARLTSEYEVSSEKALCDVRRVCEQLLKAGIAE
ncbi:MAG: PqqD family protein [Eggerthellaceae bacterium]